MFGFMEKVADGILGRMVPRAAADARVLRDEIYCYCKRNPADNTPVEWRRPCPACSCHPTSRMC